MNKFCTKCGKELRKNSKYCSKCGAKVQPKIENPSEKRTIINSWEELTPEQKWQSNIFIKVYLPIVLLICGVIMLFIPYTFLYAIFPIMVGLIFTVNGLRGKYLSCEECHSWRSLQIINQQKKGSKRITKKETIRTKHYSGYFATSDNQTGVSETEVDVPYQRIYYDCIYKCRNCGKIYNREEQEDIRL